MVRKFFPFDKNYLLEEAQLSSRNRLLRSLYNQVKNNYLDFHNPLGLEDNTVLKINSYTKPRLKNLHGLYEHLSGIYRYRYGENQLEILFDGTTHIKKYQEDWETTFHCWLNEFCLSTHFLKAVLECTILYPGRTKAALADARMKYFITNLFELKVFRYKGIVEIKKAG
ncbi:MAG: hypothetical protein O6939_04875 [Bacteroidetes bacterium]|nr:hypothetical protein [Bacteroidota bacterium]